MKASPLESHLERQVESSHASSFFWHRLRWEVISEYLPLDRPFEIVDVGAGAGVLGSFLSRERPRATYRFAEPIPSLQRDLERRYGVRANVTESTGYPEAEYIALLDVLEHQADDGDFMRTLLERVDHGATLLITVPALPALWSGWDVALGHYRRYMKRTLRECLTDLPVEMIELSYLFPELLPASLVRKVVRSASAPGATDEEALFPDPPRAVNQMLYAVGRASLRGRRFWPAGTSLLGVLSRR